MKKIVFVLIGMIAFQNSFAQSDSNAENLLESVYHKIRSYENISLDRKSVV